MKVKFLLLVALMCIGLTACSDSTSNEDGGGYTDEEIQRIQDRATDGVHMGDDDIHIKVEDCKYFCD